MRRTLILAAFLAGGVTLLAAERATFIMDNGERISGMILTRGAVNGGNLTSGNFVVTVNNRDLQLPADAVALIDFAGGNPTAHEINALPANGSQLMVLRDGSVYTGRLLNLLRGDTVRWQHQTRDTEDMPIRRIQRIYMNPEASRQVLGYTNGQYGNAPYGNPTYGNPGAPMYGGYADPYATGYGLLLTPPSGLTVPASADWVDTGIDVRAGDMLSFIGSGQVQFGTGAGQTATVDGNPDLRRNNYPVPAMAVGGLIGKVGRTAAFPIGANTNAIRMPANGRLLLGVNDDQRNDNSGAFNVVIRRGQ